MYTYTQEELEIGVNYLKNNGIIDLYKNYRLKLRDIKEGKIYCLDEFNIFTDIDKNIDMKWDLEQIIKSGSCHGLATYIYELILFVKESI